MIENVAVLGLSCALNPVLLGVVLLTLASEHPKRMLGAYLAGAFTWSVGLGIGVVTVATSADAFGGKSSPSRPIFDLVIGVALLAGAFLYGTGRVARFRTRRAEAKAARAAHAANGASAPAQGVATEAEENPPLSERLLAGRPWLAFLAGVLLNFPSVRYIAAMKEIVVANVSHQQQVLAILLFNVLMLSPAIVPLALLVVRPEGTRTAVERFDGWLRRNSRVLLTLVLAAVGVYAVIKGIVALA